MKLTWTARARTRLAELHDYIAQDSKPRALAMVERILDRADTLLLAAQLDLCLTGSPATVLARGSSPSHPCSRDFKIL